MIVGVMKAVLYIPGVHSLKEKRGVVKSVTGRIKSRFNVSVAEVERQDNKDSAVVGVAVVANETKFVNKQLDTVINFMQGDGRFYLGEIERETF